MFQRVVLDTSTRFTPEPRALPVKTPRVLLVEDDPDSAEAIRLVLEMDGLDVTWAASAQEAIACFSATRLGAECPDLVLLDLMLPGIDGVALLRRIGEIGSPPPVIVHSAAPDRVIQRAAEEVGAVAVLRKPTDGGRLREVLHSVLDRTLPRVLSA